MSRSNRTSTSSTAVASSVAVAVAVATSTDDSSLPLWGRIVAAMSAGIVAGAVAHNLRAQSRKTSAR